jgi:recombination protein RecR
MAQSLSIQKLLDEFERLPGIGPKSAQRIVYWLLNAPSGDATRLADAIVEVKQAVHFCPQCFNYAEGDLCAICADGERDHGTICVVSEPRDVSAIERTGAYKGLYHVLGGAISPLDGIGPDQLTVKELLERLANVGPEGKSTPPGGAGSAPASAPESAPAPAPPIPAEVQEVILATNPNVEGTTTAIYLSRLIKPLGIRTTRLASGLPVGGDLEFADEVTLGCAIESRREL